MELLRPHAVSTRTPILSRFQELQILQDNLQFGTLLTILVRPLIENQVPFDVNLISLPQILFDEVGQFTASFSVERIDIKEDGIIFPLSRLLILLAVVDGKAEFWRLCRRWKTSALPDHESTGQ